MSVFTSDSFAKAFGAASLIAKASGGILLWIHGASLSGAMFLQVFNRASALTGGETPEITLPVAATSGVLHTFPLGWTLGTGIVLGLSSTQFTYTAISPASNGALAAGFY